jgi:hypothetical protein
MYNRPMHSLRTLTRHPLYRRELARLGIIHPAHIALTVAAVLGLTTLLCGLPPIIIPTAWFIPRFPWSEAAHAAIIVMLFSEEALLVVLCFAAAVLAGLIGRGNDSESGDDLLLLANVPPRDVFRIRLAVVLNTLRLPIFVITLMRAILVALLLVAEPNFTFWLYDITSVFNPTLPMPPLIVAELNSFTFQMFEVWSQRLDMIRDHWSFSPWALFYIVQPVLDVLLYAAVASILSARASTRGSGLVLALAGAAMLWILAFFAEHLIVLGVALAQVVSYDQPFLLSLWQRNLFPDGLPLQYRLPYLWSGSIPLPISPSTLMLLVVLMLIAKIGVLWWALRSGHIDDVEASSTN